MKIHCIRHEPFEGPGIIEEWISRNNGQISFTHTYLNQQFPEESDLDILLIMGGTASVYDDLPWLLEEKFFIANAIKKQKKVLGICLGAQLIASVLGAEVYPGEEREIGWFPVTFNTGELENLLFLPEKLNVFHWHGDSFDLPEGSIRLASSEAVPNQGFVFQKKVIGLQFHLEMTQLSLEKIIRGAGKELQTPGKYVQSAELLQKQQNELLATHKLMFSLMDYLRDAP